MAQLVIAAAGSAIGGAVLGTGVVGLGLTGNAIGWAAGSILGSLFGPTQKSQGPRLGDLRVGGSAYGAPIPWVAAHPRIAGQVVWASDKREISTTTSQGKGGGGSEYTSYSYEVDVLILLTNNEIEGIARVWESGELVYTNLTNAPAGSAVASEATPRWSRITCYGGGSSQQPDPTYEAAVGSANAPAYRGRGAVFIEGWQLGSSGQLGNLEFEIYRASTPTLPLTIFQTDFAGADSSDQSYYQIGAGTEMGAGTLGDEYYEAEFDAVATFPRGITWASKTEFAQPGASALTVEFFATLTEVATNPLNLGHFAVLTFGTSMDITFQINGYTSGANPLDVARNGGSIYTQTGVDCWGHHHFAVVFRAAGTADIYIDGVRIGTGYTYSSAATGTLQLGGQQTSYASRWRVRYHGARVRREEVYSGVQFSPPLSPADWGVPDPVTVAIHDETVEDVVSELCQLAKPGTDWFDVDDLAAITTPVRSLKISQVSNVRNVLQMLMQVYHFSAVGGDKIYFRPLGDASVATIPWADLGADGNADAFSPRLANELEVPAQMFLTYDAVENDYQSDTQPSDRLISTQVSTETAEVPLGFTASEAKAIVDAQLLQRMVGMTTATIALDTSYAYLQANDVVTVVDEIGDQWRMRIGKIEHADQVLKCDLVMDDATIYTQAGLATAGTQGQTSVSAPPSTQLLLLDIPLLRDEDNVPGFYVAVQGNGPGWKTAALYYAANDSSYELITTIVDQAPLGRAITVLPSWAGGDTWDEVSTVTVDVRTGELASVTRDQILESASINAALIGSELIQYRTATLVATGVYTLSGLLRGRRGTGWAMSAHALGEVFCSLSAAGMRYVTLQSSELGKLRYYKAASASQRLSAVTAQTITPAGTSLECIAPVDARVNRNASDHVITWRRGTRLSTRLVGPLAMSAPLGEESESYEVDIFASSAAATAGTPVLRTLAASSQTVTYTSAQRTTDGTGSTVVYMRIYQLSASVGRGYPLITQG